MAVAFAVLVFPLVMGCRFRTEQMERGSTSARLEDVLAGMEEAQAAIINGEGEAGAARVLSGVPSPDGVSARRDEIIAELRRQAEAGNRHAMYLLSLSVANDPPQAFDWLRRAADAGSFAAIDALSSYYELGLPPVKQDWSESLKWNHKGAALGYPQAMRKVGYAHEKGRGVAKDTVEAAHWYDRAARAGDVEAMYSRAIVSSDYLEAVTLYRRAADHGHPDAMHEMGRIYLEGKGVPQDFVEAHRWFNLAASRVPAIGQVHAAARDDVARRMSPPQVADAQRLAREWRPADPAWVVPAYAR